MENRPSLAFAGAMLLVAATFAFYAREIPRAGLAGAADPGPRALPLAMTAVIGAGGLIELVRAVVARRRPQRGTPANQDAGEEDDRQATGPDARVSYMNFGILVAATLGYLLALSWLGFLLSTFVFAAAVLSWLGARWWSAMLSSLAIVMVVRVLFGGLFHVQLPRGIWGLDF